MKQITKEKINSKIEKGEISKEFAMELFPNLFKNFKKRILYSDGKASYSLERKKEIYPIGVEYCYSLDGIPLWVNLKDLAIGENWYKAKAAVESLKSELGVNWRLATPGELRHGFDEVESIDEILKEFNGSDLINNGDRCWIYGTEYSGNYAWILDTSYGGVGYGRKDGSGSYRVRAFLEFTPSNLNI